MAIDLNGINNINEYYTNHYFASIFADNAEETISRWRAEAKENEGVRTPWARLRDCSRQYYVFHDREQRGRSDSLLPSMIRDMADQYLAALDFPAANPRLEQIDETITVPIYGEVTKANGAALLWVVLVQNTEDEPDILDGHAFSAPTEDTSPAFVSPHGGEDLATKLLFTFDEPPRWLVFIGMHQIALIDRNKWNEKRYLSFNLEDIFSRREESTLQAMSVLLDKESLCPVEGNSLLDQLDENSHRHASGVSQDLKYALRECIELLGNEVIYDMSHRQGIDLSRNSVDAGELTIQCMRYMYRMLFMLFIEARPELGYAPMKAQAYVEGYSLESLRDVADSVREETAAVGDGYYLHETLSKLYDLIYNGYPGTEKDLHTLQESDSLNDVFIIEPLKAHIFDPELTPMITGAKLRNSVMLRIIDLMSVTRPSGRRNDRRGRISYSTLGINQMGAVYEALLSYRGFIAESDLYEVKRAGDSFNELDVGYFVTEGELSQYTEDERVRYESGENKGKLRMYRKGSFIYRLAGREREKSASYYTPDVLTKCLVKYALKELLEGKTADEILHLTICEPAMGSAAFLNEAINQLAEAYLDRKQKELGKMISYEDRWDELQKVKMYIADRNVYGIDLNPVAVELAEVSLWLNTIFAGGFVPWFGTQLVNGNSLIGARRQCYTVGQLRATATHWYESAPERVPLGTQRKPRTQVYHFFTGDTGMCNYTDKVIKSLEPDNIKAMKNWNKKFTEPFSNDDVKTALRLSKVVDDLWRKQIGLRREMSEKTSDPLSVYGQPAEQADSHTTIREKDIIYKTLYLSKEMKNAGPYARLKFAMDYWCALWFWPIDKAELLPTRSEFLADMGFILEGTVDTFVAASKKVRTGQLSFLPSEAEQLVMDMTEQYHGMGLVNISVLCEKQPRLALVKKIAEQNHFMHWELEFADLFAERGGFDLIIGNPPWVKITWEEKSVLSESHPLMAVRNLSAAQTTEKRAEALSITGNKALYFSEYESISAQQNYINSAQNYASLKGLQGNLYECFLPQAWEFVNSHGVFALIHPESVFNDSKGTKIRRELNARLRAHYRFSNALKLFSDVHTSREFGLNVYSNNRTVGFEQIVNLYASSTVDECYENDCSGAVYIRDESGKRNLTGQKNRITPISKPELKLFARIMDDSDDWESARLMSVYTRELIDVLKCFDRQKSKLSDLGSKISVSMMWDETNAQKDGTIKRNVHFGKLSGTILSGAHIGTMNPLFNCSNANCSGNNDNTSIDLQCIPSLYVQRSNYSPACDDMNDYYERTPSTPWGNKFTNNYRIAARKMIDIEGERTLMAALIPPSIAHTNGIIGFAFSDINQLAITLSAFGSLPYDFFIKVCGKGNLQMNTAGMLPLIDVNHPFAPEIVCRGALLNCLTKYYSDFWSAIFEDSFRECSWAKQESRLHREVFSAMTGSWSEAIPVRTAYARRQLMIELDALVAMYLGMTLEQLLSIYRIQFPILQQHEKDTYYDSNGAIVYTKNNALSGVGYSRPEWENGIKGAPAGKKFYRTITDDTQPGGPIERTIEYVAPFDRCDREQDYETSWKFFEEKYGKHGE